MAIEIVYRCDRCKLTGETSDYLTELVLPATPYRGATDEKAVESRTLGVCHDCLTKIRAFVEAA